MLSRANTDNGIYIKPYAKIRIALIVFGALIVYSLTMSIIPSLLDHKLKLFIVDDSLIVRERLVTMLDELAGIEVVGQAKTVAEAISEIRNLQPDVVILDIQMPDGSGIEVLQNIKQAEASPMVIILTNYPYQKHRQKCLEAGADFFLDKSIEFDQIPKLLAQFKQGSH
jgi:DNA-binding NarL/FixJ family response regulator